MKSANRELLDRLAAEYVLGTLRYRARRRFERWLLSPQVGAIVKAWEERLAGLEPQLAPVTPPAAVWHGIEEKLELRKLQRRPAARWLAIAASLAFFVVAGILLTYGRRPTCRSSRARRSRCCRPTRRLSTGVSRFSATTRSSSLHVQNVYDLPAGKAHELWALPEGGAPVSLGLLPQTGEQRRVLTPHSRRLSRGRSRSRSAWNPREDRRPVRRPGPCCSLRPVPGLIQLHFRVRIR